MFLRPGQGFKKFMVLKKDTVISKAGSVGKSSSFSEIGEIIGILTEATPKEKEQFKQAGTPITHTIVQRGGEVKGLSSQYLKLSATNGEKDRFFYIQGDPKNPGELNHCLIYRVEERKDLKYAE